MANITFTIPDNIAPRVLNGFCKANGYSDILSDGHPNPESKVQFLKRKTIEYILSNVATSEVQIARKNAEQSALADINTNINIT